MTSNSVTRRSFMKMSALAGAATAMGVSMSGSFTETDKAYAESPVERKLWHSTCHGCIHDCPVRVYTEDGVVVKIEGDPRAPISKGSICLKCLSQIHTVYSPRHVMHPMKLVGEHGSNKWEAISWDEAIDLAAEHIALTIQKYGGESFYTGGGGGGNYNSFQMFPLNAALGGANMLTPGGCQCYMPRDVSGKMLYGGKSQSIADQQANEPFNEYCPEMEVLVEWGAQPSVSQVAMSGRCMADMRAERGVKTVVIDPVFTPDAMKADVWLPIRPMSDTAMVLCWAKYIIDNKLYDEDFCKYWTNLPFIINPDTKLPYYAEELFPDYVNPAIDPNDVYDTPAFVCFDALTNSIQPLPFTAPEDCPVDPVLFTSVEIDGKTCLTAGQTWYEECRPWTLEKTAETCWVEADTIEKALKLYTGTKHQGIILGVFADMSEISSHMAMGTVALDILMGAVNKPGATLTAQGAASRSTHRATLNWGNGYLPDRFGTLWRIGYTESWQWKHHYDAIAAWDARGVDGQAKYEEFERFFHLRLGNDEHRGIQQRMFAGWKEARACKETGEPYPLRVYFEASGNKYNNEPVPTEWYKLRNTNDFTIQMHPMMTSQTFEEVDLFLPLEEWLECPTATAQNVQINTTWIRQQVIHLGETCHNELPVNHILEKVCEKMGGRDKVFDPDGFLMSGQAHRNMKECEEAWAKKFGAPSWEELNEHIDDYNPLVVPPEKYWQYHQHEDIADDGLPVGFATMSRKCEPYTDIMIKLSRSGFPLNWPLKRDPLPPEKEYPPFCTYHEQIQSPIDNKEYPLVVTCGRVPHWHHSTMRHAPFNRELLPVPDVLINPKTAKEYGIEHMEWVKIVTKNGCSRGRAYVTEGVAPRVLKTERFWYPECFDDSQPNQSGGWEENASSLTYDERVNDVWASCSFRGIACTIEKSTKPDKIWMEPEEFEPFMPTRMNENQHTEEVFYND